MKPSRVEDWITLWMIIGLVNGQTSAERLQRLAMLSEKVVNAGVGVNINTCGGIAKGKRLRMVNNSTKRAQNVSIGRE